MELNTSQIIGTRRDTRQQAIKQQANKVYRELKTYNYKHITRNLLKSLLSQELNNRTQTRIITAILKELLQENKIRATTTQKQSKVFYRVKPLLTFDSESYFCLMSRNGYTTKYFKYEYNKEKGIPIKKLIGKTQVNEHKEEFLSQADLIETTSNKPLKNQGVFSSSSISIVKSHNNYKIKVYEVL